MHLNDAWRPSLAAPGQGAAHADEARTPQARFGRLWRGVGRSILAADIYKRFEQAIVLLLTTLIMVIVASATWHLAQEVAGLVLADQFQPRNAGIFQTIFGMVFTVIISLEFKHSLLVTLARHESVVRLRSIILIAMLAMVRKFIILDLGTAETTELFGLSAAILALGIVYWLVRDQDQRLTQS